MVNIRLCKHLPNILHLNVTLGDRQHHGGHFKYLSINSNKLQRGQIEISQKHVVTCEVTKCIQDRSSKVIKFILKIQLNRLLLTR